MSAAGRGVRVQALTVRAARRDHVLPFRNDLEDALRTASLPALPAGATLHIRRLRLGKLPRGLSRQALAGLIEQRLGAMQVTVMRWPQGPETGAEVVILPDPVTAAALAIGALTGDRPPHWAVVARFSLEHGPAPEAGIEAVLHALADTASPAAILLLAERDGGAALLLRALGRLGDPALRRLLRRGAPDADMADPRPEGSQPGSDARRRVAGQSGSDGLAETRWAARLATVPRAWRALLTDACALWSPDAPAVLTLASWIVASLRPAVPGPVAQARLRRELIRAASATGARAPRPDAPLSNTARSIAPGAGPNPAELGATPERHSSDRADPPQTEVLRDLADAPDFAGVTSRRAGVWLMIPVIRLIGAEAAEEALGIPICAALLQGFLDRAGLSEADPARPPRDDMPEPGPLPENARFRAHDDVLRALAGASVLSVRHAGTGRATLGLRHGPDGFARLDAGDLRHLRQAGIPLARAQSGEWSGDDAIELRDAFMLAGQRLVTRLTDRGWRHLAGRAGRVAIGPTHVDITFDGQDADPEVRRAGLDFDPGWVPWLGRVVRYRYDYSRLPVSGQRGQAG